MRVRSESGELLPSLLASFGGHCQEIGEQIGFFLLPARISDPAHFRGSLRPELGNFVVLPNKESAKIEISDACSRSSC